MRRQLYHCFPISLRRYHIIVGNAREYELKFRARVEAGGYPTLTRLILEGTSLDAKTFEQLLLHKLEFVEVSDCGDVFTLFPAKLRRHLSNCFEKSKGGDC